jgi:hypothetical protein
MLRDLDKLNLKRPVHTVTTERRTSTGSHIEEREFDPHGRLIRLVCRVHDSGADVKQYQREFRYDSDGKRLGLDVRVKHHGDGSRTEIVPVCERNVWSMDGLHDHYFGTYSACRAQTRFDSCGPPIETRFQDIRNDEVSRVRYVCDANGRILEAVQSLGPGFFTDPLMSAAGAPPLAVDAEGAQTLITLGIEAYRLSFRYDDAGRVTESESHFFGRRTDCALMTYNDRGDILTLTTDDKPLNCFEYEYDEHDNWIRKIVRYAQSSKEESRRITYYS